MAEDREPSDDELKERLRKLLGERDDAGLVAPPPEEAEEDPVRAKLSEIEERTRQIRERHQLPDPPDWNYSRPKNAIGKQTTIDYKGVGLGFSVLYALIGPLFVGLGIGWFIDSRTGGGGGAKVWGLLIGSVCGLIGAVVTVTRGTSSGPKS